MSNYGDFDTFELEQYLDEAKGIAWDTCHKIYVLMDSEQMTKMTEYGYDPLLSADDHTPAQLLQVIKDWYERSCGLRFIEAVETDEEDPNAGFHTIIPQFYSDEEDEECRDCGETYCNGICDDEYEEENEDEETE